MQAGQDCVGGICCNCWTEGCGLDGAFGHCADCLEFAAGPVEYCADLIWCFGSPLAFPLVFCFSPEPQNSEQPQGPGGGWDVAMLQTPMRKPVHCCFGTTCPCCAQWLARREALHGDMTKYKLWQGFYDGPQCCARACPGAPITIEAGTYGEDKCPEAFLCLEVTCLGGISSVCCAHGVTRRLVKQEYNLGEDPTEIRVNKCTDFFGTIMHACCQCAMCLRCASCLVGCCAPESEGAQECSGEGARAARACFRIGVILWRGIQSVKLIAMGCMVAQQSNHLRNHGEPQAPVKEEMDRPGKMEEMDRPGKMNDMDGDIEVPAKSKRSSKK